MRLAAFIKARIDLSQVRYSRSERRLVEKGPRLLSPVSENVLEAACRIKEAEPGSSACAVLLGDELDEPVLKKALAFGLDEAFFIAGSSAPYDHFFVSKVLAAFVEKSGPFGCLVVGGDSEMGGGGQTGVRLAELLCCDLTESIEVPAKACVVRAERGSNTPRIPSVMTIMKAASKPIHHLRFADLTGSDDAKPAAVLLREEWVA